MPAAQISHLTAPVSEYSPAGQSSHTAPPIAYVPAEQFEKHVSEREGLTVPGGQGEPSSRVGDVRCPASQPVHSDEDAGATWPGAQGVHCVPFTAYVPDSHTVHRSWSEVAIEPASHDAHDEDAAGATSPGEHATHGVPFGE